MLESAELVAFVATSDVPRARTFYAETLGLELVGDDGFALVFDAHGTTLRVTQVAEVAVAPYTALGWLVADLAASVAALAGRGVVVRALRRHRSGRGRDLDRTGRRSRRVVQGSGRQHPLGHRELTALAATAAVSPSARESRKL